MLRAFLSYAALGLFLFVLVVDVAAVAWDVRLLLTEQLTVSQQAWAEPVLVLALVGWQLVGAFALAAHLLIRPY